MTAEAPRTGSITPRAMLLALGIVIVVYILVSTVIVMTLTLPASTWITLLAVLALSFVFEVAYRKSTGRSLVLESTAA